MKINKHICFRTKESPALLDYLKHNNIPFDEDEILSSIDILESDPHWPVISKYAHNKHLLCQSETIFSKEELQNADWLTVRSQWKYGYPQPEDNFAYEAITYSRDHYCKECASGLVQIDTFRIKKVPKWGKRNFLELNWIGDELFLSEEGKSALEKAGLSGVSFNNVKNSGGTKILDGIYQLTIPTLLKEGLVENHTGIRETYVCPCCGTKKYVASGIGMLAFEKECFCNAPDVVKSAEIFGSGQYASRVIIVRQKAYQAITENGLGRSLVFEPIMLL